MKYYLDIKCLPDSELTTRVLMNAIFAKFHKLRCEIGKNKHFVAANLIRNGILGGNE